MSSSQHTQFKCFTVCGGNNEQSTKTSKQPNQTNPTALPLPFKPFHYGNTGGQQSETRQFGTSGRFFCPCKFHKSEEISSPPVADRHKQNPPLKVQCSCTCFCREPVSGLAADPRAPDQADYQELQTRRLQRNAPKTDDTEITPHPITAGPSPASRGGGSNGSPAPIPIYRGADAPSQADNDHFAFPPPLAAPAAPARPRCSVPSRFPLGSSPRHRAAPAALGATKPPLCGCGAGWAGRCFPQTPLTQTPFPLTSEPPLEGSAARGASVPWAPPLAFWRFHGPHGPGPSSLPRPHPPRHGGGSFQSAQGKAAVPQRGLLPTDQPRYWQLPTCGTH